MPFAPAVDPRLVRALALLPSLDSSADALRALRRRARRLHATTPCYESVRRLVHVERERRARIVATLATALEVAYRRTQTTPADVAWIFDRNLARSRNRLHARRVVALRASRSPKRRGPPFGGPRSR